MDGWTWLAVLTAIVFPVPLGGVFVGTKGQDC